MTSLIGDESSLGIASNKSLLPVVLIDVHFLSVELTIMCFFIFQESCLGPTNLFIAPLSLIKILQEKNYMEQAF